MKLLEAIGPITSALLPAAVGCGLVKSLWPKSPKFANAAIGIGVGLGIAGTTWMLTAMFGGSASVNFTVSESLLVVLAGALYFRNRRISPDASALQADLLSKPRKVEIALFVLALLLASTVFGLTVRINHHGDFDATAIWNVKARLFYLRGTPLETLPDVTAPDYPLLLPSVVTRGWQYSGRDTIAIPISLAIFFAVGSLVVLVSGLRLGATMTISLLSGCLLVGTPYFLSYSLSQTADIVMCFYITSAVTLLSISDFREPGSRGLPFLSGLLAGFAACTKNEGSQFIAAMILSLLCLLLWDRRWKLGGIRLGFFLVGLAPPVLALSVFRSEAIPSILFANMTLETILTRIRDTARHSAILAGYWRDVVHWGEWWINPLAILLAYILFRRVMKPATPVPPTCRFPALALATMICGYYLVYLFSPYEVNWHVASSLPRLLFQLWPTTLLCWGLLVTRNVPGASTP